MLLNLNNSIFEHLFSCRTIIVSGTHSGLILIDFPCQPLCGVSTTSSSSSNQTPSCTIHSRQSDRSECLQCPWDSPWSWRPPGKLLPTVEMPQLKGGDDGASSFLMTLPLHNQNLLEDSSEQQLRSSVLVVLRTSF